MLLVLICVGEGQVKHTMEDKFEEPELDNVLGDLMLLLTGGNIDRLVKESKHGKIPERLSSFSDKFDGKNEKLHMIHLHDGNYCKIQGKTNVHE